MHMAGTDLAEEREPKAKPPSRPAESPETYQREEVTPDLSEPGIHRPAYRPFPGNTAEDEIMMKQPPEHSESAPFAPAGARGAEDDIPNLATVTDDQAGTEHKPEPIKVRESTATSPPRMAPSLKADKPRKKRSFFKRLFGLK